MSSGGSEAEGDDAELIRRFVESAEQTAFRLLYRRHTPAVYGLVHRLTGGNDADASDVVQEAWVRVARGLPSFRGASAFRTWLTGIALNCYREWRRRARRSEVPQSLDANEERPRRSALDPSASSRPDEPEHRLAIADVLKTMSPDFREVLVLHDVEGYTHEEIAAALGIETGTSKSRLSRARQMFRELWQRGAIAP